MEVTTLFPESLFYVPLSRAGPQGQRCRATTRARCHAARFLDFTGPPCWGQHLTFLRLVAVNPNIALWADAEEGGLINPRQASAPILTVVYIAEVTWKKSHMSLQAIPTVGICPSPADAQRHPRQQELLPCGCRGEGSTQQDQLPDPVRDHRRSRAMVETRSMRGPVLPWHVKKGV